MGMIADVLIFFSLCVILNKESINLLLGGEI